MVSSSLFFFFFNDTATTEIYPLSLHDALPILGRARARGLQPGRARHSHAVRCAGDVQGGRRRADVPEIMSPTIKRVLVANRGEIALRIIRACHEEGLEAVAVYSEVDRLSPHVRAADLAVPLGPPTAAESYLDIGKLVAAAQSSGCQAVHPGYGFLSERAPFAEAVAAASLEFIGPPAAAIRAMGDKTEARRRMQQAGVPIVRSEEHTSELQSRLHLVCRLLLEKK